MKHVFDHPRRALLLLVLAAAAFLPALGKRDVVTSHEARVIQTARQMAEAGWPWVAKQIEVPLPQGPRLKTSTNETLHVNPWLIPVMNGHIRLEKPPLPYWITAAMYRAFGTSALTSRLIPALLGALATFVVWDLARLVLGRTGAWWAAFAWVSTHFILDEYRKAMADPYLAFFVLLATWLWLRNARPQRAPSTIGFYIALALVFLAKGPVGLLIVAVMILWLARSWKIGRWKLHAVGIVLFLALALPWYALVWQRVPNALELWRYESVGPLSEKTENARPWWFYLPNFFLITLPWTPIVLLALLRALDNPRSRRWSALGALLTILVLFSFSLAKKNAYLLPAMPLIAILVAQGSLWIAAIARERRGLPIRLAMMRVCGAPVVFMLLSQIVINIEARRDNDRSPRQVCELARSLAGESGGRAILTTSLPDEASVYLPLRLPQSADVQDWLVIADDRRNGADAATHAIPSTPGGAVVSVKQIPTSQLRGGTRWKLYALHCLHAVTSQASPAKLASAR